MILGTDTAFHFARVADPNPSPKPNPNPDPNPNPNQVDRQLAVMVRAAQAEKSARKSAKLEQARPHPHLTPVPLPSPDPLPNPDPLLNPDRIPGLTRALTLAVSPSRCTSSCACSTS